MHARARLAALSTPSLFQKMVHFRIRHLYIDVQPSRTLHPLLRPQRPFEPLSPCLAWHCNGYTGYIKFLRQSLQNVEA